VVARLGAPGDRFLIAEYIGGDPQYYVQVWHESGGEAAYELEWREGSADRHYAVTVRSADEVAARMTAWARRQDDWNAGLVPHKLDLALPEEALTLDDGDRTALEARVREVLHGGYASRAELAELAEYYLVSGDDHPVSSGQARTLVDRLWGERLAEQAGWEGETDPERLTRAFAALDAAGITARENFACCRNCGTTEIAAEAAPGARGFVYFHTQCTDSAAAGQGLTLLYGGFDGSAGTTASVGHEVAAALAAVGLPVVWDGNPDRGLTVQPISWRRRLAG
jgi:hypothetical protein